MNNLRSFLMLFVLISMLFACEKDNPETSGTRLQLISVKSGTQKLDLVTQANNIIIAVENPIVIRFTAPLDQRTVSNSILLETNGTSIAYTPSYLDEDQTVSLAPSAFLQKNKIAYTNLATIEKSIAADYPKFTEIEKELKSLAKNYPSILKLYSIGKSTEGRDLYVMKISKTTAVIEPTVVDRPVMDD